MKMGLNQHVQYNEGQNGFDSKFTNNSYGQSYQPLQQNNHHYKSNQLAQNNPYPNSYGQNAQLYFNNNSIEANQSPYHQSKPPNYHETMNKLYHRQEPVNNYNPKDNYSTYAHVNKLQGAPYGNNPNSRLDSDTNPPHPYGYNGRLPHNYDPTYAAAEEYKAASRDYLNEAADEYKHRNYMPDAYKSSNDLYDTYGPVGGHPGDIRGHYKDPTAMAKVRIYSVNA